MIRRLLWFARMGIGISLFVDLCECLDQSYVQRFDVCAIRPFCLEEHGRPIKRHDEMIRLGKDPDETSGRVA